MQDLAWLQMTLLDEMQVGCNWGWCMETLSSIVKVMNPQTLTRAGHETVTADVLRRTVDTIGKAAD